MKTGREGEPGAPSPHLPAPPCSSLLLSAPPCSFLLLSAPPLVEVVAEVLLSSAGVCSCVQRLSAHILICLICQSA